MRDNIPGLDKWLTTDPRDKWDDDELEDDEPDTLDLDEVRVDQDLDENDD